MGSVTLAVDLEMSGLESILLTVGAIGTLVTAIVVGVLALRNRR
jgi:hypothetical protein